MHKIDPSKNQFQNHWQSLRCYEVHSNDENRYIHVFMIPHVINFFSLHPPDFLEEDNEKDNNIIIDQPKETEKSKSLDVLKEVLGTKAMKPISTKTFK